MDSVATTIIGIQIFIWSLVIVAIVIVGVRQYQKKKTENFEDRDS